MAIFFVIYGPVRSIIELWRDDPRGFATLFFVAGPTGLTEQTPGWMGKLIFFQTLVETIPGRYAVRISESQLVSLGIILLGVGIWIVQRKRARVSRVKIKPTGATTT